MRGHAGKLVDDDDVQHASCSMALVKGSVTWPRRLSRRVRVLK